MPSKKKSSKSTSRSASKSKSSKKLGKATSNTVNSSSNNNNNAAQKYINAQELLNTKGKLNNNLEIFMKELEKFTPEQLAKIVKKSQKIKAEKKKKKFIKKSK